ncbi:MAG TPA: HEAT repeat domain-containing protein [Bryobacteraceae bacterium]|nr:HEAT repeat domain-containing protein [Bryobacteraceae bacterium]
MRALLGPLLLTIFPLSAQTYLGAQSCSKCHPALYRQWTQSHHARILQPATPSTVRGDFTQSKLVLDGAPYALRSAGAAYYITFSGAEHRIDYILGDRRIQHYLTKLPDGRIVLFDPTWDIANHKWIAASADDNPEEAAGSPVWNQSCYSCHVSQPQKNFDLSALRYNTAWRDFGANCETCHGPGSTHKLVNPTKLDAARSTMICAQCHSLRDIDAGGFPAGANYYDYFQPVLEFRLPDSDASPYWPDGRPRSFANEAVALWQSLCFLKGGASCATCHSVHKPAAAETCARCHTTISAAHSHHPATIHCVDCHMPETVLSLNTRMRDHSISVPAPENTIRHAVPNACNLCHHDKDAAWAARQVTAWYGETASSRRPLRRAGAFTSARKNDPAAIPPLLAILSDPSEGPWIRANAAGWLGRFSTDPAAYSAVLHAFSDPEPLVRATATIALSPSAGQRPAAAEQLVSLLKDPTVAVRMNAAIALVGMGVQPFSGEDGERFERAKQLYAARADLNADDPQQQFAAGRFFLLAGDTGRAAAALRSTLTLDPQNAAAQRMLAELEKAPGNTAAGESKFRDAQSLYQGEYYVTALDALDQALREAPDAGWSFKAQVYRAVCLEKIGRTADAESAMRALSENPAAPRDLDLQLAYVELLYETGRPDEALKRLDAAPESAMTYFWRARVLLQLHRAGDAASTAEKAIALQPELPQAHNLLIRIYQMLGRPKDAAHEAQWLRDYERRKSQ